MSNAIKLLAMAGLSLAVALPAMGDPLTAKTRQGDLHGMTVANGKVKAFVGIPYAAPPVGHRRWKAPEPPATWQGVRDATKYGSRCISGTATPDMVFFAGPSEDCLYLNVYAPIDATASGKLPVMFWIHGGGFFSGSGGEPRHNPDFLVPRGVLLVTFNYRLSIFGFLATRELAQEAGGTAGNYGFMDQIAALQWVKDNIAGFGGNPENVTIFGESAGSGSVSTLVASPMARGLFQKAIGESGASIGGAISFGSLEERLKSDSEWASSVGVKNLTEFRAMPADKVVELSLKKGMMGFPPNVDGKVLVESVTETYMSGRQSHVPLLSGWNADEGAMFSRGGMTAARWKQITATLDSDDEAKFLAYYPGESDAEALKSSVVYAGDAFIALSTWRWIEAQTRLGDVAVYCYHFELPAPEGKYFKGGIANHADEIEYVFGTLDTRPGAVWRPEDRKLSEQMMEYWTNFAKRGDPNGPGLPAWPRYDRDHQLIHLNSSVTAGPDEVRAQYEFLMGLKRMPSLAIRDISVSDKH